MKPIERWPDTTIDAVLRDVAVPAGLADRVRLGALFDDRAVDRIIGDVPVPVGLAARLRPMSGAAPVPSIERPSGGRRAPRWLRGLVRDGAAVALALGVVVTMFVTGLRIAEWAQESGGVRMPPTPAGSARSVATGAGRHSARSAGDGPLGTAGADRRTVEDVAAAPRSSAEPTPSLARSRPPAVRVAPVPLSGGAGTASANGGGGPFPGMRVVPDMGAGQATGGRRAVPGMRGFDLAFEMAHGEAPFVDPSIAPGLAVDRPPLVVATDSFDRVWPLPAGRRRRTEIDGLRVEHVLAALSTRMPTVERDMPTVGLSAVRALRPGRPTYLVEVCIDASVTTAAAEPGPPRDAVLVLDHSAAPGAVPLWMSVCRGLAAAAARMAPSDRLTVIVAEPRPRVVAIQADADGIRRLASELEGELPFGIADLDAAMTLAREVTTREGVDARIVVVAQAEQAERCVAEGREVLNRWREAVSQDEMPDTAPRFLLVSGVPDGGSAALAGMPGWTLSDPTTLRRRLSDLLAARDGTVLEGGFLEVRFDPAMIAAYRLVGHRQSVPESLSAFGRAPPGDPGVGVHQGEAVRVVYEVVPRQPPRNRLDGITATFTGRDASGHVHSITTGDAPLDPERGGVPSAAGCELLLAVAVGEFPGRSAHAVPKRAVVEGVRRIAAAWERRGDMTGLGRRLLGLFDDLDAAGATSAGR